jgi:hypothetical protein
MVEPLAFYLLSYGHPSSGKHAPSFEKAENGFSLRGALTVGVAEAASLAG